MNKNILICIGFVVCFALGFICGMFANVRITSGKGDNLKCADGFAPDAYGCCIGEEYIFVPDAGVWACCPDVGDCFTPLK